MPHATFAKILFVMNATISCKHVPMMFAVIGCVKTVLRRRHANYARVHFVVGLNLLNVKRAISHSVRIVRLSASVAILCQDSLDMIIDAVDITALIAPMSRMLKSHAHALKSAKETPLAMLASQRHLAGMI